MKSLEQFIQEKLKVSKKSKEPIVVKSLFDLKYIVSKRYMENEEVIDMSDIDISELTDISGIFSKCKNLRTIIGIEDWDTKEILNMREMFEDCYNLHDIGDLSGWDTSNVKYMTHMFYECKNLECKGIDDWNVENVRDISEMFYGCKSLTCDLSKWKLSSIKNRMQCWHIFRDSVYAGKKEKQPAGLYNEIS